MSEFLAKTANLSLLALAALPIIALSVAHAEPASVQFSDLDLSQPAQVQVLNDRIERAAVQYCGGPEETRSLSQRRACIADFRAEAMDQIRAAHHRQDEARTSRPSNAG